MRRSCAASALEPGSPAPRCWTGHSDLCCSRRCRLTCARLQATLGSDKKLSAPRLEEAVERGDTAQVRQDMRAKIENILALLNRANTPEVMDLPGFRLHPLKGDLRGAWAVTVRANWRIIWRFEGSCRRGRGPDRLPLGFVLWTDSPAACGGRRQDRTTRRLHRADEEPPASWAGLSGRSALNLWA